MDDESQLSGKAKVGLGVMGLGAVGGAFVVPKYGIWIALAILILFLLLFGGYFLWQRLSAKKKRERFSAEIQSKAAETPQSISDPNKRAELDKLRQKFQKGLHEFKSRGKDIYRLPWYVIIGEPGSGKSEALRHSGVEFPPGMQDEMQGSGGTVNMDWWFTNRGIILDTAGSMLFNEAKAGESPQWRAFLALLRKARPNCPVNGLFLVLSIESLIKDSADTIAQKASRLAQQLDLIQRALDVRFPVYLLVTKSDLLIGFREFFDGIDDPMLQHQMFGWSNPDPLDSPFRPDMVPQHLKSVVERLRRRRLSLLRGSTSAGRLGGDTQMFYASKPLGGAEPAQRKLDEVDSQFALTESLMRLAPRLQRYLETIFVAGEWSAKPVFLRGIYFTSSMRDGKALDEAIALATGLPVDDLPEERSWQRDRAFFLRDLFIEKVFRESGLVTRATNTLQMLRKRQFAIFGSAGVALLLVLAFAGFGYRNLQRKVGREASFWKAGAAGWNDRGDWSHRIVRVGTDDPFKFAYAGTNVVDGSGGLTLVQYQSKLRELAGKNLNVGWIFKPVSLGINKDRATGQRIVFESGILKPLIEQTRNKMINRKPGTDGDSLARYQRALTALIRLEADQHASGRLLTGTNAAADYLQSFLGYLTESNMESMDTNLVSVMEWTYSKTGSGKGKWPPEQLLGGDTLNDNAALRIGLENYREASRVSESRIQGEVDELNLLVDSLKDYQQAEQQWLARKEGFCVFRDSELTPIWMRVSNAWERVAKPTENLENPVTNLASVYVELETQARGASEGMFKDIASGIPDTERTSGLFAEIDEMLRNFQSASVQRVSDSFSARSNLVGVLDADYVAPSPGRFDAQFVQRWSLYARACALASGSFEIQESDVGDRWKRYNELRSTADSFREELHSYDGGFARSVTNVCVQIAGQAETQLRQRYVADYIAYVSKRLAALPARNLNELTNAVAWMNLVTGDLGAYEGGQSARFDSLRTTLEKARESLVNQYAGEWANRLLSKLGFPVFLSPSAKHMKLEDVVAFKRDVATFQGELGDPVWAGLPKTSLLERLEKSPSFEIVNALVTDDGSVDALEFWFVPPTSDDSQGRDMLSIFRVAQIELQGDPSRWGDLTRPTAPLLIGKGPLNSGMTLRFRKLEGDESSQQVPISYDAWGLIRLIEEGRAERDASGSVWRVRLPLEDKDQELTGDVHFEVRLKRPLPKVENWPRK